ncbi:MAG: DNA translocase FtsK 4TM domain-containing protein [Nitrospiraceae bacterium]|nr:DNA translocase FtsK 4TM domain-containing protein [Nitrospiraceae bacterium]
MSDTASPLREHRPSGLPAKLLFPLFEAALAVFMGGALVTLHPDDPSLFTGSTGHSAINLFGMAGATMADLLYSYLGLPSLLLPLLLGWHAVSRLKGGSSSFPALAGTSFLLAGLSPLFATIRTRPLPAPYPPGGLIGTALVRELLPLLNRAGLILLFGTLSLGGFLLLLTVMPAHRSRKVLEIMKNIFQRPKQAQQAPIESAPEDTSKALPKAEPEILPEIAAPSRPAPASPPKKTPLLLDIPPNSRVPPASLLDVAQAETEDTGEFIRETQKTLAEFFRIYQVAGRMAGAQTGPVITLFEFAPSPGLKVNRVTGLASELALTLKVPQVRIQVPVPDKSTIGIEVPNPRRSMVSFREIYESLSYRAIPSPLALAIGKTVAGEPYASDLARMPHLLVAGATGTGKSVCLNGIISSLLMKNGPENVRLLMIDPKRLEMAPYEGIPHLLGPVVTEPGLAVVRLRALVGEMLRRYDLMKDEGVKNIGEYKKIVPPERAFPYIVVVIDELADLMLSQKKEVEPPIIRLAQMARAAGIHLVLATQRPSAQVVTGLIKTNIPTKIAFQVSSQIDSRVILDTGGAEFLLGAGDMLIKPPGSDVVRRLHGAYISEDEVHRIVEFWRRMPPPPPLPEEERILAGSTVDNKEGDPLGPGENDPEEEGLYQEALSVVVRQKKASTSLIQRHLRIGYNRAARLIDRMESEGVIGPSDGTSRPRPLLKGFDRNE